MGAGTDTVLERLAAERAEMQTLIQRSDTKAQAPLTTHSLLLAGALAVAQRPGLSLLASVAIWAAATAGVAALVFSLAVIFPRLRRGRVRTGITAHADHAVEAIERAFADDDEAARRRDVATHVGELARIATAKFTCVRIAIVLLITGVALVALAVLTA